KPFSADDTWLDTAWDNRALPHPKRTAYSYEYAVLFYFAVPAAVFPSPHMAYWAVIRAHLGPLRRILVLEAFAWDVSAPQWGVYRWTRRSNLSCRSVLHEWQKRSVPNGHWYIAHDTSFVFYTRGSVQFLIDACERMVCKFLRDSDVLPDMP
ncbi:MAG: hypothetical protein PHD32_04580, partial [Eubacteriales bacterium]|nr:hypothetical protein [Eubacteriales bacterium]